MLAIVQTGGRQYPVREGDEIIVQKLDAEAGATVALEAVAAFGDDGKLAGTTPAVEAEVLGQGKARKVIVFKKKRRKGFHKKQGHRQPETTLRISKIK